MGLIVLSTKVRKKSEETLFFGLKTHKNTEKRTFFKKNEKNREKIWWNKKNVVPLHRNSEMSCNLNKKIASVAQLVRAPDC